MRANRNTSTRRNIRMTARQGVSEPTQSLGFPTSRYIHLNVGGITYMTSQETLTRYPDSMLGFMFTQERIPLAKDEQGRFLIDRDGTSFRYILNYLRDGMVNLPESPSEYKQLLAEARFYQLEKLVKELCIHLNVNGVHYSTSRAILTNQVGSLLTDLFSQGPIPLPRDQDGRFLMRGEVDGHLFEYILNFLEHGDLRLPAKFDRFEQLKKEARHYKLGALERSLEVCLDVGGHEYTTSRDVLTRKKGSMLEEIFSQTPIPLERDQLGRFLIHRNGRIFKYLLEYLRTGKFDLPEDTFYHDECEAEIDYHRLGISKPGIRIGLNRGYGYNYIGGEYDYKYEVSWENLTKYKGSLLEEKFAKAKVGQPTTGLSGDGATFRCIISFLSNGSLTNVPISAYPKLLEEARRYRLHELERLLTDNQ